LNSSVVPSSASIVVQWDRNVAASIWWRLEDRRGATRAKVRSSERNWTEAAWLFGIRFPFSGISPHVPDYERLRA
jgi:hypothetical protein